MSNINFVKEHYKLVEDDELIRIAERDGSTITPEAFVALREEFRKRNIDTGNLDVIEERRLSDKREKIKSDIYLFALNEKFNCVPNSEIEAQITDAGVS